MRILLDNDVALDYILKRPPSAIEVKEIFGHLAKSEFDDCQDFLNLLKTS